MPFRRRGFSAAFPLSESFTTFKIVVTIALLLLAMGSSFAQQQQVRDKGNINVPAGTRITLVLTDPVDTKVLRRGDEIHAQTTAPIAVGRQVAIPAGTFVQGRIEKLARRNGRGQFELQSLSLIFPDGYISNVAGPMHVESDTGTALLNPSGRSTAGAILAPLVGFGAGAAIGSAAHTTQSVPFGDTTITTPTHRGVAIGSIVGSAAGGIVSLVLLMRSRDFYVEAGAPMETTLSQAIPVEQGHELQARPLTVTPRVTRPLPRFPEDHGMCRTPDIPGTPPVVIPGTPPVGDSPGTPDIVIPGTPPTPGTPYPCP